MRIVLTNDDGYQAPGLKALYRAAKALVDVEISVIAPAETFSSKGHVVSQIVRCRRVHDPELGEMVVVDGSPSDCARLAVSMPDQPRPDWVLSGINHGGNLGVDIFYSGTVAAAREAAILGIPAIALSQLTRSGIENDWSLSASHAAAIIAAMLRPDQPPPPIADRTTFDRTLRALELSSNAQQTLTHAPLWNVNLPCVEPTEVKVVPTSTDPLVLHYHRRVLDDGTEEFEYAGNYHDRLAKPGTDVATVFAGGIAISLLPL